MDADRPPVIEEYEKLLAQHADDPVYLYLAALAELGRNTTQSVSRLERAIERSPSFGLPHLLLARIYSASSHSDPEKVKRHLDRFEAVCPDSVRGVSALRWSKDLAVVARTGARIRRNLKDRTDAEALASYPVLWALEAAQRKSDEQAENVARMKQDVARCGPCRAELPYFEKLYRQFQNRDDIVLLAFNIDDDIADMNKALAELKVSIPSVYAAPFVYSMLAQTAIPANWLLTPARTQMLYIDAPTLPEWQMKVKQAIEKAAAR